MKIRTVGVIGAGTASEEEAEAAYKIGKFIAENGFVLVCGGLYGVMEACSRGAGEAGGTVVGILPGGSASEGNRYLTIPIVTNMGHARNIIIAHTSDVLFAVGGGYGTLSEIAISLKLGKVVIGVKTHQVRGVENFDTPEEAILYFKEKFLKHE